MVAKPAENGKQERQRVSARARIARKQAPPPTLKPSDFIKPFSPQAGGLYIVCARVSTQQQADNGNLQPQVDELASAVQAAGAAVVATFTHVGSGYAPRWLSQAVEIAKQTGACILIRDVTRAIRHPSYHPIENPTQQAELEQFQLLASVLDGVELQSLIHPDTPLEQINAHAKEQGQEGKGNSGGRPTKPDRAPGYRKRRKARWLPRASKLRSKGMSYTAIADMVSQEAGEEISWETIRKWLAE